MSKCAICGRELADGVKFCVYCGAEQPAPTDVSRAEAIDNISNIIESAPADMTETVNPAETAEAVNAAETANTADITGPTGTTGTAETSQPAAAAPNTGKTVITFSDPPHPAAPSAHFAQNTQDERKAAFTPSRVPVSDPEKPGPKSKWQIMSTWGTVGSILLMKIPVVGLILAIVWACGGCRKYAKRNLARAVLIFIIAGIILSIICAIVLRFAFPEVIIRAYEYIHPGYTIRFN